MKKLLFNIGYYIDYYRMCLAAWIHPETYENAEKFKLLMVDLYEMEHVVGKNIPEVQQSCNWLRGKYKKHPNGHEAWPIVFPAYAKYKSLTHFKDVLENDYKRKLK